MAQAPQMTQRIREGITEIHDILGNVSILVDLYNDLGEISFFQEYLEAEGMDITVEDFQTVMETDLPQMKQWLDSDHRARLAKLLVR